MLDIMHKHFNLICTYLLCLQALTVDFYYFISLLVTLCLAGVTRSAQSKTCWLHFLTHFLTDQDEKWFDVEEIQVEHSDATFKRSLMK